MPAPAMAHKGKRVFAAPSVRDFVDPAENIDVMQRYVLQLVSMTDEGVSSFAKDKSAPNADHSIKWIWLVQTSNEQPIFGPDGQPWEMWEWTGNRTGRKKDGSPSKARERLEALVGRELADDQITRIPLESLPGRKVQCLFHRVKTTDVGGQEVERTKILKVAAYKSTADVVDPHQRDLVGAAAGRPDAGESKSDRQARLRAELEAAEKEE